MTITTDPSAHDAQADSNFYDGVVVGWIGADGLRVQRLDPQGRPAWGSPGTQVTSSPGAWGMAAESFGPTWFAWASGNTEVRAQFVSYDGQPRFGVNGTLVASFPDLGFGPIPAPLGSLYSGRVLTWAEPRLAVDGRRFYAMFLNRISPITGLPERATPAVVCDTVGGGGPPVVVSDFVYGVLVFWLDRRNAPAAAGGTGHVYGTRLNIDAMLWSRYGLPLGNRDLGVVCRDLAATSDPRGGAYLGWTDDTNTLRVQRIDGAARRLWDPDGIPLGRNTGHRPVLVRRGGTGGLIVGWAQGTDLAVCTITPDGTVGPIRRDTGVVADAPTLEDLSGGSDGAGGAVFAWTNRFGSWPTSTHADGWAQRVDTTGTLCWTGSRVHTFFHPGAGSSMRTLAALPDGVGGIVYLFQQGARADRDTARGVYATRTNLYGIHNDDGPTATATSLASTHADVSRVELRWLVGDDGARRARVERRTADVPWGSLGSVRADGPDRIAYDDFDVAAGERYAYRLAISGGTGAPEYTAETWVEVPAASADGLRSLTPNPSAGAVRIRFALARESEMQVDVLDAAGRHVKEIASGKRAGGEHTVVWRGDDARGATAPPGLYFLRWRSRGATQVKRLVRVTE